MPLKPKSRIVSTTIHFAALVCSFLLATRTLSAQLQTLDVSQYLHESWNAQDGFFTGGINSVTQTSDGYLWLTSAAGLLRFDGIRFVQWNPPARESLPGAPLRPLLSSRDGSLWIGGTGVAELTATGEFHRYYQLDGLEVAALLEAEDGAIWVGGVARPGSAPLCRVFRRQSECYGDTKFMGGWADSLYEDKKGQLWAGTNDGIWRIRPGLPQRVVSHPSPSVVRTFAEDPKGTLLFSDADDLKALTDDGKVENYPVLLDGKTIGAWKILKDRDGSLWFAAARQGLVHIHQGRIDRFTAVDGLVADPPKSIFQDHEGNIWVTSTSSLERFTKPAVPRITTKEGLVGNSITSVVSGRDGATWIGTEPGLSELISNRVVTSIAKLPKDSIESLFATSEGRLLAATDAPNGMVWVEGGKSVPLRVPIGEDTFEIAEDSHGDLWIVNRVSGLVHLRGNGSLVETVSRNALGLPASTVAYDAKRNGLWLTSARGELVFFKNGEVVERYGPQDGLTVGVLRDPQVDDDGAVWISTQSGLARLMHGKITTLGQKNGLPCDAVHWMRRDDDRNVWLYTKCGLVSFSDKDLSSWIAQPSHIVMVRSYLDNTEGVENTTYGGWYTPQTAKTADGRILFAMTSGLGILDPRNLQQNALPPPVYIEEVTADGHEIKPAGRVSLPKPTRTLHLAFTALSLVAPRKVRFRYKLEGYDNDWSGPVAVREATYTNLPPGDYDFRVIACNNDGVWNEAGASWAFSIAPAWFQTNWFRIACAGALLTLMWGVYQLRLQQLRRQFNVRVEERVNERTRIARELHDTLLQSLHGLMFEFQAARNMFRKRPKEALQALDGALAGTERAITESQDAIENLRSNATAEDDLSQLIKEAGENLAVSRNADYDSPSFGLTVEGQQRTLTPVIRDEIYGIAREVLRNAFRHAQAHRIEAEILYDENQLRLRVRDDGKGLDPQVLEKGAIPGHWGLPGVRERAQKIGAKLDVWSEAGAGTEVQLAVAASIAYQKTVGRSRFRLFRRTGNHEH